MTIRLPLPNGWTISISEDVEPALCNVAAAPTKQFSPDSADEYTWFDFHPFGGGSADYRCYCIDDLVLAVAIVRAAAPPEEPQGG